MDLHIHVTESKTSGTLFIFHKQGKLSDPEMILTVEQVQELSGGILIALEEAERIYKERKP